MNNYSNKPIGRFFFIAFTLLYIIMLCSSCTKDTTADPGGPTILSINPDKGYAGTVVTITGKGFSELTTDDKVMFDGIVADIIQVSSTQVIVEAPVHATGKVNVSVITKGKSSNSVKFEYISPVDAVYFPTAGKRYHYKVTSPSDIFEFYTKLLAQKDSANGIAVRIGSFLPETTVQENAYRSSTETIFQLTPPADALAAIEAVSHAPNYVSSVIEGFPLDQRMSNSPLVNEPVNFTGGPIHLRIVFSSDVPGVPFIINDFKQYYLTGKVLGYENVTTTAGTFTHCMKWEYYTKIVMEATPGTLTEQDFHRTVWFADGIGPVKDIEEGPDGNTESELVRID